MNRSLMILLALVGFLAVFGLTQVIGAPAPTPFGQRDAAGCFRHQAVETAVGVLIDFTDAPAPEHLTQLEAIRSDILRTTPISTKVLVGALTPTLETRPVTLLFAGCNPGSKQGAFTDRPSPAPIDQIWRLRYAQPLAISFDKARELPTSKDASPLLEAITAMTGRADFDGRVKDRRLVVLSDGLQLTPGAYSHFRGGDLWQAYLASPLWAIAQADLTGVRVEFVYLLRPEFAQRQTERHRAFLSRWLISRGASSVVFRGVAQPVLAKR